MISHSSYKFGAMQIFLGGVIFRLRFAAVSRADGERRGDSTDGMEQLESLCVESGRRDDSSAGGCDGFIGNAGRRVRLRKH